MKLLLFFLLLPSIAFATDTTAASPKMVLLLQDLRALEKYMQSEQEFSKKENGDSIKQSLEKLRDHAKNMDGNL
jgi:formyltetrahydrofolate synthetase